jgi:hypothetical protein
MNKRRGSKGTDSGSGEDCIEQRRLAKYGHGLVI